MYNVYTYLYLLNSPVIHADSAFMATGRGVWWISFLWTEV